MAIIPKILRDKVLTELHTAHSSIVWKKSCLVAGIDENISRLVRSCQTTTNTTSPTGLVEQREFT